MKCCVLMRGRGWREDGDIEPVRVFADKSQALQEFEKLEAIRRMCGDISGEKWADREARLPIARAAAEKAYADLGYEADGEAWWELFDDVLLAAENAIESRAA